MTLHVERGARPLAFAGFLVAPASWKSLAVVLVGSLYHTACLDNLTVAFRGGCLQHGWLFGGMFAFNGF